MTEYKMMDEVVGYCSKCKLELNQRIVRVEAGRPKRVLCLTCKTERAYRKSAPTKAGEGKVRKPRTSPAKVDLEAGWRLKLDRKNKTPKAYAMDKSYLLDDHIDHKLFGVGLVVSLIQPDKINVFFQDGLKTMKCGQL
jgi:hypothetical protein